MTIFCLLDDANLSHIMSVLTATHHCDSHYRNEVKQRVAGGEACEFLYRAEGIQQTAMKDMI